jgi:amino acid adenylation domain-containing protein
MIRRLHQWVTREAERRPEAIAVVMNGTRLTYEELEVTSNRLAHALRAAGCGAGDRVGFLLDKSPLAVVTILGILKADGIYVPIDPANPRPRIQKILNAAEPRLLLCDGRATDLVQELSANGARGPRLGWLERDGWAGRRPAFDWNNVLELPSTPPERTRGSSEDVAYLLFTSGSTGVPKGVPIKHANVIPFVRWAIRYFGIGPDDRNSGHTPFHFDLSVLDLFGSFAAGAQLHIVPTALNVLPTALAEFIRRSHLTQWFSVPSVLNLMAKADVVNPQDFSTLKRILWCGEVFPTPALIYWMTRLPHVSFTNLYGPTETTVASSYYTVPRCPETETEPIPIGRPCDGEGLLVLDEVLEPVPAGTPGDLYIRGVGLSPGYWRDAEKTRAAFLPNPHHPDPDDRIYRTGDLAQVGDDGLVYFLGRADFQVKHRGYRIELGEIECALHTLDVIEECAAVALPSSGFEGSTLCCAYTLRPGAPSTPSRLREELRRRLPAYMLPARWIEFEQLPKNANGKIDRAQLQQAFEHDEAHTT